MPQSKVLVLFLKLKSDRKVESDNDNNDNIYTMI